MIMGRSELSADDWLKNIILFSLPRSACWKLYDHSTS